MEWGWDPPFLLLSLGQWPVQSSWRIFQRLFVKSPFSWGNSNVFSYSCWKNYVFVGSIQNHWAKSPFSSEIRCKNTRPIAFYSSKRTAPKPFWLHRPQPTDPGCFGWSTGNHGFRGSHVWSSFGVLGVTWHKLTLLIALKCLEYLGFCSETVCWSARHPVQVYWGDTSALLYIGFGLLVPHSFCCACENPISTLVFPPNKW